MTPKELKILLLKKDVTQQQIATEAGTSNTMIHLVVYGLARSKRIENIIARRVCMPIQDIFPIAPEPMRTREEAAA